MADKNGGIARFEDVEEGEQSADFAPPAPPVFVSPAREAARCLAIRLPAGWASGWHPVPKRQFFFCLSGEVEIAVSGGERRTFTAGDAVLGEDTWGKGHQTRVLGGEDVRAAVVQFE